MMIVAVPIQRHIPLGSYKDVTPPPPPVAQHVCLSSPSLQCWESLKFKSLFLTLGYVTKAATLGQLCAEVRHCLVPFALTL